MEKLKSPAFQFYSSDFITGTMFMSNEEVGAYIRCLCMQHQKGHLKEKEMMKICLNQEVLDSVMNHYKQDDEGLFYNERLDFEKEKREKFIEHQRENGKKGGRPKTQMKPNENPWVNPNETQTLTQMKPTVKPKQKPLEDEEEDINKEYIINYYINNINTNISSIEYSKLEEYINIFSNDLRIIIHGIEYCKMYKAYNINYLCRILNNWNKAGYKTLEDIKLNERKIANEKENKESVEVYDMDWLNED